MTGLRRQAPPPPVRIVHLGLGAFHRSHQVLLTARASDGEAWGFASFAGRHRATADALAAQDGLYTLVERGPERDSFTVVPNLARTGSLDDDALLRALVAEPATALITTTVTEAGYHLDGAGVLDLRDRAIHADIDALRVGSAPSTPLGRLTGALDARRRAGAGPIAIIPCDNLADAGRLIGTALHALAEEVDPLLAAWIATEVPVASCSVDRITPAATEADRLLVEQETGAVDASPVVAEPFVDWTIEGEFPAGRPEWGAGVAIVDDVTPYENRKLWMLNGAHTLLALAGGLRGHTTVAEAIADRTLRGAVDELWDECERQLTIPGLADYRAHLLERFANGRIRHELAQIRADTGLKLRLRVIPVLLAERAAGRRGAGAATVLAAWVRYRRRAGERLPDDAVPGALAELDRRLADPAIADLVRNLIEKEMP